MPVFVYKAANPDHSVARGTIASDSPREARELLRDRGMQVLELQQQLRQAANQLAKLDPQEARKLRRQRNDVHAGSGQLIEDLRDNIDTFAGPFTYLTKRDFAQPADFLKSLDSPKMHSVVIFAASRLRMSALLGCFFGF